MLFFEGGGGGAMYGILEAGYHRIDVKKTHCESCLLHVHGFGTQIKL